MIVVLSVGKITLSGIQSDPDFTSVPTLYLEVKVITLDHDKADQVFGRLMELYKANGDPYSRPEAILPEDPRFWPDNLEMGGTQEAQYWFALCYYMRGAVDSTLAAQQLGRFYEKFPDVFEVEVAASLEPDELRKLLFGNGLPFMSPTVAKFWVANAQYMATLGFNDVRQLYIGVESYDELVSRITKLDGFQRKMVSMITYYLDVRKLLAPLTYPIPVDFHVMRIVNANEMLIHSEPPRGGNYGSDAAQDAARELTAAFCERNEVAPRDLAAAVWLFSNVMCGNSPVTAMTTLEYKARATEYFWVDHRWTESKVHAFNRTCGVCPLSETCEWSIGAPPWYRGGVMLARERRRKDPRYLPPAGFVDVVPRPPKPSKAKVVLPPVYEKPHNFSMFELGDDLD